MWTKQILGLTCYSLFLYTSVEAQQSSSTKKTSTYTVSSPESKKQPETLSAKKEQEPEKEEEEETDCLDNPASFRLSIKHREANGIGYNNGYSSLDGFFAFTSINNWHPFFDLRLHVFNDDHKAANAGFGVRYQPDSLHTIFGLNGFFDFRRLEHSTFEQLGLGIEALGTKWEFRLNGYLPIINRDHLYDVSFSQFTGNHALFSVKRDLAFQGFDLSIGRTLLQKQFYSLSAFAGSYMFFANHNEQALGGLIKLKSNISRYFALELQTSYDTLFNGIVQGQAAINLPFGKKIKARKKGLSCRQSQALADRLAEEVDRFEIIVCNHHNTSTFAKNPNTGEELFIVFVNNTNTGGNGTAESPFKNLVDAQTHSSPNQMIYVYEGNGTTTGQDAGITLKNNQWMQGSGIPLVVATSYGLDTIPAQTTGYPTIGSTAGDTITLANGNTIAGFNILAAASAINGANISDLTVAKNSLSQGNLYDLFLNNVSGNITITDNTSSSNNGLFINSSDNINLVLKENLFVNAGAQNIKIQLKGNSVSNLAISFNTFQNSQSGSSITTQNTTNLNLNLLSNTFKGIQSTASAALQVKGFNNSNISAVFTDNTFSGQATTGLNLSTTDRATTQFYVVDNTGTYSGSNSTAYPFTFVVDSLADSNLLLVGNVANATGYHLTNNSPLATFEVQSPTLSLAGVESLNTGSFTVDGTGRVTFVSYNPDEIPVQN